MAEEIAIAGTADMAKKRSPIGVVGLTLITLGIYWWVWYYKINREMRDLGRARGEPELGDSPGTSLLAVTLGLLIIVPALVSLYNTTKRVMKSAEITAVEPINGWIALILYLVIGIVFPAYLQSGLNKVWDAQGGAAAAIPPAQEAAAPAPPAEPAEQPPPPPAQ